MFANANSLFYPYLFEDTFGTSHYLFVLNIDTVSILGCRHLVRETDIFVW